MLGRSRDMWLLRVVVIGDDAERDASEDHAMRGALSYYEAKARSLPDALGVGARDLERRVAGFRSRIDEEDVIHAGRCERGDALGKRECGRMGELEGRCVIEFACGLSDRFDDRLLGVAGIDAPKAGTRIQ